LTPRTRRLVREVLDEQGRVKTPGEESRLLQHARPHLHALIIAALETGCRVGELLSLQWKDVDLDQNVWLLPAANTKTREARDVPITTRLKAVMEMRRLDPAGKEHPPEAYVFGNDVGERAKSIRQAWRNTCRRAGIAGLTFHDLRREFASRLLESGAPAHEVRDWLGHSNITTTSRYLATTRIALQKARQRFEQHRSVPVSQLTASETENTSRPN
jgi:integrase